MFEMPKGWILPTYEWEDKLDYCDDYTISKTGLSREKLKKILEILSDNGVLK